MFIAALFTIATSWKQPRSPSTDEQNRVDAYNGYYSTIKRNEVLIHATTWINLENILREINQTQKGQIFYDFTYMKYLEWANL